MDVSIIIPARNEEAHLGQLLESIAKLQYPADALEVIVVDHSSTDDTPGVAARYGARVLVKQGGTISSVRNYGARAARGKVIAFVDADCTVAPDWATCAVMHFQDPSVGAVGSYHLMPDAPATWVRKVLQRQAMARPRMEQATWLPSGNMFVGKAVYDACGGFDESLTTCEDVDISYRISRRYRVIADDRIRCWHHGEPIGIRDMFRKELWRGRDNFSGAFRHGFRVSELPSLFLPTYMVLAVLGFLGAVIGALLGSMVVWLVLVAVLAFLIPLAAVAVVLSVRSGDITYAGHFAAFYAVYLIARGLAPLYHWRNF